MPTATSTVPRTTTVAPTSTTIASTDDSVCPSEKSSPANFDATHGQYAAYLYSVDTTTRVASFDVIQFLAGNDAITAYHKANPSVSHGPPDDYFIINSYVHTDHAVVTADAQLWVVDPQLSLSRATLAQMSKSVADSGYRVYWLTFANSQIIGICQQYTP